VVVYDGQIIGEGWHRVYGGPHAEVNAIASVQDKSVLPKSRVYVTLEPCSHFGKTPPCADLLIDSGVRDVVICNTDPNPQVAGRGIKKLFDAGAQVKVGVLEDEGLELNKRFFTFHAQKRPYIVLKWAESADGFIGGPNYEQVQISGPLSRRLTHKWRSEEQAIMVGSHTAAYDNPRLDTRFWPGHSPLRIVIDRNLKLPNHLHLFDKSQPTVVYTYKQLQQTHENLQYVQLREGESLLAQIMGDLHKRNVLSLLVEGGTYLHKSLLKENLWNEVRYFKSKTRMIGEGTQAPVMVQGKLLEIHEDDQDLLFHYKNDQSTRHNP
ncbi:MAG: bifunctional diaminohydroxyphosphoribosylaminopyrimidine deaminase/5-amino-6-(5-phosphoribosylamino)uracil reductase RibD, partial [Hymenobacteraceae bacterium]|nr:bifunctional diaminohydroxyphosphoribosylaminopyrimidine deaminase/5-amino-6-(5-phosphoribosylamino)uracil reductase RibD [Hymenobacteraceae bacterium]